jgi:hypothetical protein
VKKLIGLALELPPLPLGFAEWQDKRPTTCLQMKQERFVQRAMKRCSRERLRGAILARFRPVLIDLQAVYVEHV